MQRLLTLRRFVDALVRESPRRVAAGVLVTIGLSLTEGVNLLLLIPLLQLVGVETGSGSVGRIAEAVSAALTRLGIPPTLLAVLGVYVAVTGLQTLLQRSQMTVNAGVQHDMALALRTRLYRAIAGLPWVAFTRSRVSEFTHALTDQVDRVAAATYYLIELVVASAIVGVYVMVAVRVSAPMTGLVLACGALLVWLLRRRLHESFAIGREFTATRGELYAAISEHLGSMKTARSYNRVARHVTDFDALSRELRRVELRTSVHHARLRQHLAVGTALVMALVVYVAWEWLAVSTAQLLLMLFLFGRLMPRVTGLYERAQSLVAVLPAFDAVMTLESTCAAVAEPAVIASRRLPFGREIRFHDVAFAYDATREPAVQALTLRIRAGSTVGVVGASGAGKTTIADLLMGLLTPTEGGIFVDDERLDSETLSHWRDQIGYVAQDTFLFDDTVRANLQWARPDATEPDLWRALRLASAEYFVAGLSDGLDTRLGSRGLRLSGGERQRLALARALLREPKLLVLDEATSSLDSENEGRIQEAIDGLHHEVTIVVIAHRLATVRHADVIYVLDHGRLVESGTWQELMARPDGRFRQLYAAQHVETARSIVPGPESAAGRPVASIPT